MKQSTYDFWCRIFIAVTITCTLLSAFFLYKGYMERQAQDAYSLSNKQVEVIDAQEVSENTAKSQSNQSEDVIAPVDDATEQLNKIETALKIEAALKFKVEMDGELTKAENVLELARRDNIDTTQYEKIITEERSRNAHLGSQIEEVQHGQEFMAEIDRDRAYIKDKIRQLQNRSSSAGVSTPSDTPIEKERREFLAHTASVIAGLQQKLTPTPISHGGDVEYEDGISLSPLIIKKDHIDVFGYQWIAYKTTVHNNTNDERKVYPRYAGIDNAGFKVRDIILSGTVPAHTSRTLTNNGMMKPSELIRIHEWVLDK